MEQETQTPQLVQAPTAPSGANAPLSGAPNAQATAPAVAEVKPEIIEIKPVKSWLAPFISLSLLFILIFTIAIWQGQRIITAKSQELTNVKAKVNGWEARKINLRRLSQSFSQDEEKIKKMEGLLPKADQLNNLLESLNQMAVANQAAITLTYEAPKDQLPVLSFKITAKGNQSNLAKYLKDLENSPYIINVSNFTVAKDSQGDGSSMDINLKTYVHENFYQPEEN
ncbi:MAG: hypothetical protein CEN88_133 [Candidatus Berkelbacteria bacterium Licking1014_2]|uniref:Type IV pilus assembly protein PilO n=1 Tax=Candidatus Berkelbacteria bacterium Licking1014_2 TaxID=2017146 RepID=A0A554LWF5_9BACT|nr:MAG: hypothetical protein CEN88_133 [Candidatus Berkelbacteria bacterium Licking1014_2]